MGKTKKSKSKGRGKKRKTVGKTGFANKHKSKLRETVWAVIDGAECFGKNITYRQAQNRQKKNPGTVIVTSTAADRLLKRS